MTSLTVKKDNYGYSTVSRMEREEMRDRKPHHEAE